jgi:hypothetical protein
LKRKLERNSGKKVKLRFAGEDVLFTMDNRPFVKVD